MKDENMLIVRLSALGDVAMTIPVVYSLARQYPDLRLTVLTSPFFARLFIGAPKNITLLTADTKGEHKGVTGMLRLIKMLSQQGFTSVADLHNVLRSWTIGAFFRLKGVPVAMVDKGRKERRRLLSHTQTTPSRSYILRYADVFGKLGYPVDVNFRSLFDGVHSPETPVEVAENSIGIAPFARYYNKTYPLPLMKQVAEELTRRGLKVFLFGGRGREKETLDSWERDIPGCVSVAGKYPIEQELAIMSRLDAVISMDSANQHLASLAGTRVVSIWGSTTPACGFTGYGQKEEDALCLNLECQPCTIAGAPRCRLGSLKCMKSLTVDMIVEKTTKKH